VLCLCFRFEDELAGVFARLAAAQERSVMLLLDAAGTVIASSDRSHIPVGARMTMVEGQYQIVAYAGRDYLATTCSTAGYQGYHGMGWHGHVMVPLSSAFRTYDDGQQHTPEEQARLTAVQANAVNFCPALAEIANDAENINRSLRRVVWNGQVMAASSARAREEAGGKRGDLSSLKVILQQISETGDRTSRVFGKSIRDLYGTVISSLLADARFIAGLMIDIMDRNLYERANDCRWWALASDIRRIMAGGSQDPNARERIAAILAYINSLYTVYTRLFVYDVNGVIVAASNLHQDGLRVAGQKVNAEYVARTLALSTSQDYVVSAFEPSSLYGNQPTYIYNAAIHDPHDAGRVVGGIGIVFDSTPEFSNMLAGALPDQQGAFALFVDRAGTIIASTSTDLPVGSRLPFPCDLTTLANGDGLSTVVTLADGDYILGAAMSSGYREYKRSGDYHNDVAALVLVPLGADEGSDKGGNKSQADAPTFPFPTGREVQEFATFYVGEQVYALPAAAVLDSVDVDQLNRVSGARRYLAGLLPMCVGPDETRNIVPIIDTHFLLGVEEVPTRRQIIVVQAPEGPLGLLVDELYMVPEVDQVLVEALPEMIKQDAGYISGVIRLREDPLEVVQILDPEKIFVAARAKSLPDKIIAADPTPTPSARRQNGKAVVQ
jgi:chemotaxis signal transduction protein